MRTGAVTVTEGKALGSGLWALDSRLWAQRGDQLLQHSGSGNAQFLATLLLRFREESEPAAQPYQIVGLAGGPTFILCCPSQTRANRAGPADPIPEV